MKCYIKWFAITIFIGMLSICARTAPMQQISTTVSVGHTQGQAKNAILKVGAQRKWIMTQVFPGVVRTHYQTRNHVAEVRITCTATYYNIKYDNSLNLQISDGKTHRSYNRWVRNLDKDVQVSLSTGATL